MRIINEVKLGFDDVMIVPKRSTLSSRKEVNLERTFNFKYGGTWTGIPIMAANMSTVGNIRTARILDEYGMFTCLHKFIEQDEDYADIVNLKNYALSFGSNDKVEPRISPFICLDVANGYTQKFIDFVKKTKDDYPNSIIIAGNVVTPEMTEELILSGASIVKVGIGSGGGCRTRSKTGIGYPQLSAAIECADAAHGLKGHIISDGGIRTPSDMVKAFAANSDFVMVGSVFAVHDENVVLHNGNPVFYGMSSSVAMNKYYGKVDEYRTSEGSISVFDKTKGSLHNTIQDYLGGLRSACTYVGATSLKELTKRTTFIRVTEQLNRINDKHTIGE